MKPNDPGERRPADSPPPQEDDDLPLLMPEEEPDEEPRSPKVGGPAGGVRDSASESSRPSVFEPAPGGAPPGRPGQRPLESPTESESEEIPLLPVEPEEEPEAAEDLFAPSPPLERLSDVDQPYRRSRELEPLLLIIVAVVVVGILIAVTSLKYSIGPLVILAGLILGGYRLSLALDPPVRVTPEQAVKEFYGAFCHRLPNYHRMYMLLTVAAREAPEFGSYNAFKSYWRWRRAQLTGRDWTLSSLDFRLVGFQSEYNEHRTFAKSQYHLRLFFPGKENDPVLKCNARISLTRGPDGAWYLNDGTLPQSPPSSG